MTVFVRNRTGRPIHLTVVRSTKTPNLFTIILSKSRVMDPKLKKKDGVLVNKLLDSDVPESIPDFTKDTRVNFDNRVHAMRTGEEIADDQYIDLVGFLNGNHP